MAPNGRMIVVLAVGGPDDMPATAPGKTCSLTAWVNSFIRVSLRCLCFIVVVVVMALG